MTSQTAKPRITDSGRCTHRFPNGRRCRLYTSSPNFPNFCPIHARLPQNQADPAEVAATLTANLHDFTSATQINDFLSRLLLLLAHDKISTRRAAVLAYITNQLLRTLSVIAKEEDTGITIIHDGPRPDHPPSAVPATPESSLPLTPNPEPIPA